MALLMGPVSVQSEYCFKAINKKCDTLRPSEDREPANAPFGTRTISAQAFSCMLIHRKFAVFSF